MDWLPDTIRRISLPSVVYFTLFLWNGLAYLGFARILPLKTQQRMRFFLFGILSLCLALYSFATFELYSAVEFQMSLFWNQVQLVAMLPTFLCFVLFTCSYLEVSRRYFYTIVPLVTLGFVPFMFWEGMFFLGIGETRHFSFLGYGTHITEARPGPVYFVFLGWALPHVVFLVVRWLRVYREHFRGWALPFGMSFFVLTILNDVLVGSNVYRFFYFIDLGFAVAVLTMAFQLFKFYVQTVRELELKTREVASLNEEMQFLISAISHDLKAPLISIRGFAELLGDRPEVGEPKRGDYLRRIEANAAQTLEWLDDLIQFMKLGWLLGSHEEVDVGKVASEVDGMLIRAREERGIRISWPETWPALTSSAKGLKQILLNLLQNAVKFSPEGGAVEVECFREYRAIQLWISDHGPGVPEECREKIFQPFFRHRRDVPGSGMGLAIVKKAVERLGGRVWLDAGYTEGARFCVYLPDQGESRVV